MKIDLKLVVPIVLLALAQPLSWPGHAASNDDGNSALIRGEAGENYPIVGTGGIRVSGGHHGMWMSNMKTSTVLIDGSGILAQKFPAVAENSDFNAACGSSYFVSQTSVCMLPQASTSAGQEVVVCNTASNGAITYKAQTGDRLFGANQAGVIVSSQSGKVDRFLCDGSTWYRE